MNQIRPITDLRTKLSEIDRAVTEENRAVILTRNGYGHMVLLSYEEYGRLTAASELYREIDKGMEDIRQGRLRGFNEAMSELHEDIRNGRI